MFGRSFAHPASHGPSVRFVDVETLKGWLAAGHALLVDVREPPERLRERIAGSAHHPLSTFDPGRVTVEPGKKLVLHCASGVRCGPAADRLIQAGRRPEDIYRLQGGLQAWKGAGLPVEGGA